MEQNNMLEPTASTAREDWEELLRSRSFWGTIVLSVSCFVVAMLRLILFGDRPFDLLAILFAHGAAVSLVNYLKKKQKGYLWVTVVFTLCAILQFILFFLNRSNI